MFTDVIEASHAVKFCATPSTMLNGINSMTCQDDTVSSRLNTVYPLIHAQRGYIKPLRSLTFKQEIPGDNQNNS